jgi:TonB-linked SusC/RagA family outer membrane protein
MNKFSRSQFRVFLRRTISILILIITSTYAFGQGKMVSGNVYDSSSGSPIVGASVRVVGNNKGVSTNDNGSFTLAAGENSVIEISNVGYRTVTISADLNSPLRIDLVPANTQLSDVVVIGYGTQRKKDITGSVAVVDMKALNSIPTGAAAQALQGQASGVNVISSGVPGGRNDIFVRGVTSFGNTQPLVVIDGVQGELNDLNMNDIESIQVLKDAGAASIYGVRGSNGVILITTKKGKKGEPSVNYDAYYGVQTPLPGNVWNLLTPEENAANVLRLNPSSTLYSNGGIPDYTYKGPLGGGVAMEGDPAVDPAKYVFNEADHSQDYQIQKMNKQGTDLFHAIFKPAPMQSHNLTASGATDKSSYLFSLGYLNQQGTLINTYLKRYSARVNTEFKLGKNIKVGQNAYFFYKQNPSFNNQSSENAITYTYRVLPLLPIYDIMGNYAGSFAGPEIGDASNPVAVQDRTKNNKLNTWDVVGNIYAEVDFLKHFTARTSFGGTIDNRYNYNIGYSAYENLERHTENNSFSEAALFNSSYTWTNVLHYKNTFGNHKIDVIGGTEAIRNYGRTLQGSATNFFSLNPNYLVLSNGTANITNFSSAYLNTLFSLFGRVDYTYNNRYLFAATLRRDGSSVFGSSKRYGVFPSFSLGWRVSDEGFMKNVSFVNDLKLKGSYGVLGSQANVDPNNAYTLFSSGFATSYYDINGTSNSAVQGFAQSRIGNSATGWEQDKITNFGFEATVLDNKVYVSVERYKKSVNGLLFPLPLPSSAGNATPPTVNIGDIANKGWDISATFRDQLTTDFRFSIGANITTYKNQVVNIPDPGYFDVPFSSSLIGSLVRNQEGHPVGSFYGYQVLGLFRDVADVNKSATQTDAAPGRFKYEDVNGDGQITPDDRTFIGNPNPKFTYGLNLGFNYKNFDFSGIFYGSQGNDVLNMTHYYTDFYSTSNGGLAKSNVTKNAWTPDNLNAKVPVLEFSGSFSSNGVFNSYYKEDGSFLKMRSLIAGYTFNSGLLRNLKISKLRVYLQGANLFTITKYSGLDPELGGLLTGTQSSSAFGVDYANYPNNQRSFLLGANITF